MEALQELRRQHAVFAEESFAFLMYNSQVERECFKDFEFFRSSIGDAISAISYIFKKDYWKTFNRLHENLKHVKMFEKYCMIIPVAKDERYFYNFLKRISLIFELAMYCYNEGFNYFKIGLKCVAEYEDLKFFESSGGWTGLEHAAQFIESLGRPLTLIMNQKYLRFGTNIETLPDAVRAVRKLFMIEGNLEMLDSKEMYCLMKLKKRFKAHSKAVKTKKGLKGKMGGVTESPKPAVADTKELSHNLKKVLKSYFGECFSCLISSMEIPNDNLENVSLKCAASVPAEDYPEAECSEKVVSETMAVLSIESQQNPENRKLNKNSTAREDCNNEPEPECLNKDSEESLQNISNLNTDKKGENKLFLLIDACNIINGMKVDSSAETKHVDEYVTPCPTSSNNSDGYSSSHMGNKRNIQLSELRDNSLKCTEPVQTKYYSTTKCFENALSETNVPKPVDTDKQPGNYNLDKNLIPREEYDNKSTFIVSQKYLSLKKSDNSNKHLYSSKMRPPSIRKKLDGHLKKILDANIESQNYTIMPSGDIHVCPPGSPSQDEETLVIFAESSTDEEGDPDIDTLMCLFKKIEIDSQGKESGYSLRPRLPKLRGKERLKYELDSAENVTKEMTATGSGSPSKFSLKTKHKSPGTNQNEILYAKVLIKLYKKYFTSFLDKYFKTDFSTVETEIQSTKSCKFFFSLGSIGDSFEYVFAVSARIMAKRKVLLDNPDKSKRVLAFQIYGDCKLTILPLPLQKVLDSQIKNLNYFVASDGVYGVGPKRTVEKENVWVILCSDDWLSHSFDLRRADAREILATFRSYEPVLLIAIPLPEQDIKINAMVLHGIIDTQLRGSV